MSPLFNLFQSRNSVDTEPRLGLVENWRQFSLLVALNLFVGGMIGLERTILPVLAEAEFGITSKTAAISFIASFGISKAMSNLFAGNLAQRMTRRRILISGWLFGLPVPLILIWAPDWGWVIGANVLLGINQGLTWSMTVNMKMDLAGPRWRGLALGFNETAGYLALAAAAFLTGIIAQSYGLKARAFLSGHWDRGYRIGPQRFPSPRHRSSPGIGDSKASGIGRRCCFVPNVSQAQFCRYHLA